MVGLLTCLPFLVVAIKMLQLHLTQHARLVGAADTDMLTKVPSRRSFFRQVEASLPAPGAIMMVIDIDHFKKVNDTFGHAFGDHCLISIANELKPILADSYVMARLGGEEFGIFIRDGNIERARCIGAMICAGVRLQIPDGQKRLHVTSSVGATIATPTDGIKELLSRADYALYRAKDEGRARMVLDTDPKGQGGVLPLAISG